MNIGSKVLRGSVFLLAVRMLRRGLGFVSTLILARLLLPADFGIVAIAILVIYFAETFANAGTRQYLIQIPEIDDDAINTAWCLDLLMKCGACALIFALLPLMNLVWDNTSALYAIAALAPTIALKALQSPQLHVDVRNLEYGNVVFVETSQRLISFVVIVGSALVLRSWWAIIIGHYSSVLAGVALSWWRCSRPIEFGLKNVREQWMFSKWILSRSFLGYLRAQTDAFFIARFFPVDLFGKFTVAREITVMPAVDIVQPLTEPLLSSLSRVRHDPTAAARQVYVGLLVVALVTTPMCAFLYRYSETLVDVLLGPRWTGAGALIVAMTPLLFSYSMGGITNNLLLSLGRVRTLFWYDVASLIIVVAVLFAFRNQDLTTLVFARGVTGFIVTGFTTLWVASLIGASAVNIVLLCSGPVLLSLGTVMIVPSFVSLGPLARLIASAVIMCVIYGSTALIFAFLMRKHSVSWRYLLRLIESAAAKFFAFFGRHRWYSGNR